MSLRQLELVDFRIFRAAHVEPEAEGTTVITGPNGTGKTSVLEAVVYLGTRRSFRGAPPEALVRTGARRAPSCGPSSIGRDSPTLVEAEIAAGRASRTRVNRKAVTGRKDLAAAVPCTIFSPEDLAMVSGGPKGRRDLLDDALALLDPEGARAADETERVLRQRAALLRQAGGRGQRGRRGTLDVWDQRLADAGKVLVAARERLVADLETLVGAAYSRLAGAGDGARPCASATSGAGRGPARRAGRQPDRRPAPGREHGRARTATTWCWCSTGREARTHASQGEQRCLALALRLGVHELVRARTALVPTLLLDDVFSELDPARSRALVAELPAGQSILTTAAPLPEGIDVARGRSRWRP